MPAAAAHNAVILEAVARMAYFTIGINPAAQPVGSGAARQALPEEARGQRVLRAGKGKEMMPALATVRRDAACALSPSRCRHCRFLLRAGAGHRILPARAGEHRRRLLHGRARDDGLGGRAQLSLGQSRRARIDGLGGFGLPVRHSGDALVLDRRHSGDAVPGAGDDAVLLHFQNPLGAGIFEIAFRRTQPRPVGDFVRIHDRADERRQHVCHGQGHADRAGMGHQFQHLGLVADGGDLRDAGRPALGHLQ